MPTLAQLKREYQHVILDGMADSLWAHAYRAWDERSSTCVYCGSSIDRETTSAPWRDRDGGDVCPDYDDGDSSSGPHVPDNDNEDASIPPTPDAARLAARDLNKLIAQVEGIKDRSPLADLYEMAMEVAAPGFEFDWGASIGEKSKNGKDARLFGSVMAALSLGVKFDDVYVWKRERGDGARFEPKIPTFSIEYNGEDLTWEGSEAVRARFEGGDEHPLGPDEIGDIRILNPEDANFWKHSYVLGTAGGMYLVYASSLDSAFDELVDWAVEHAPWHIHDAEFEEAFQVALGERGIDFGANDRDDEVMEIRDAVESALGLSTGGNAGTFWKPSDWAVIAEDPSKQELLDIAMKENPKRNAGVSPRDSNVIPLDAAETRGVLSGRVRRCSRGCPGWAVFDTNNGPMLQACDDCNGIAIRERRRQVTDADVAALPEAQRALARELATGNPRRNGPPPGPPCPVKRCTGALRKDATVPGIWRCTKCGRGYDPEREIARARLPVRNSGAAESDSVDVDEVRPFPRAGDIVSVVRGQHAGKTATLTRGARRGVFLGTVDGARVRLSVADVQQNPAAEAGPHEILDVALDGAAGGDKRWKSAWKLLREYVAEGSASAKRDTWKHSTQARDDAHQQLDIALMHRQLDNYVWENYLANVKDKLTELSLRENPKRNAPPEGPQCPRSTVAGKRCTGRMVRDSQFRNLADPLWRCRKCGRSYWESQMAEAMERALPRQNGNTVPATDDDDLYEQIQRIARREMGEPFSIPHRDLVETYRAEQAEFPDKSFERVVMMMVHG